jgi:hypothetical protein
VLLFAREPFAYLSGVNEKFTLLRLVKGLRNRLGGLFTNERAIGLKENS